MTKATILIPTTKHRAPVLPYSVGSALSQTEPDIEILIIGDGVDPETREAIEDLQSGDKRVRFFDHPKGERRGETYRHEALSKQATGDIVCYLLDRDLMLPDHVARAIEDLQDDHNFSISTCIDVNDRHELRILRKSTGKNLRKGSDPFIDHGAFRFSSVSHTMELYRSLPYGWRKTPANMATDRYMWLQIIDNPNCLIRSTSDLTILYFKRGNHPGWEPARRAEELAKFYPRLNSPQLIDMMKREALARLINDYDGLRRNWLLVKGNRPSEIPSKIWKEVLSRFARRW